MYIYGCEHSERVKESLKRPHRLLFRAVLLGTALPTFQCEVVVGGVQFDGFRFDGVTSMLRPRFYVACGTRLREAQKSCGCKPTPESDDHTHVSESTSAMHVHNYNCISMCIVYPYL